MLAISVNSDQPARKQTMILSGTARSSLPRGYKTSFMLNSAEHEICPANYSQNTNKCIFFLAKHS